MHIVKLEVMERHYENTERMTGDMIIMKIIIIIIIIIIIKFTL